MTSKFELVIGTAQSCFEADDGET